MTPASRLLAATTLALLLAGCSAPPPGNAPLTTEPAASLWQPGEVKLDPEPAVPQELLPGRKPDRRLVVGISLMNRAHQFYKDLEAAMREEAARWNVEVRVQSADFKLEVQRQQVQDFLAQKVDALVICPVDTKAVGTSVADANRAGVPVFTADVAAASGDVVCHIASNNRQGGQLIGEHLATKILHGEGEIVILDYPIVTSVQHRVKGFEDAIRKYPGIKIVEKPAVQVAEKTAAFPFAQNAVQAHPDIKAIFGINDDTALAAAQAVKAAGKRIFVVGFDGTPEAAAAMKQGSPLQADAVQYPRVIGRATLQAMVRHANGESVPREVPIPCGLVAR
ncbi:MAG: substrate-binding domain-containing protein [Armatimonadetes bacterium]|nr:substrate-binding domain-containing protein [Armatimonadota bacterium]